uniref:Myb-like domain-containing protein n=1 Tax=Ananas comosus var. bracteatus TaxID=296719 RepID=A0A6V7PNG3_ANACO|nr:unnamed protein product [Ananas comosus var. bracteatus]
MPCADGLASEIRTTNSNIRCSCTEPGSIQCAKQHVMEVRENLKTALGPDRFEALGFCEMGEDVALKWTEEEERLFQEVVLSNPASLGKNFWDELPHVFSSKNSKELVSYYFNVFMLRKRAEQNRSDPMNVDSDNDEWQESDDGEFEEDETEEDSAVDSLTDREDLVIIIKLVWGEIFMKNLMREMTVMVKKMKGSPEKVCEAVQMIWVSRMNRAHHSRARITG